MLAVWALAVSSLAVSILVVPSFSFPDSVWVAPNVRALRPPSREAHFQAGRDFPAGNYPCSVAIGLLNGDSIPDLAVADYGSNSVSVLLGIGDGTFHAARDFPTAFLPYVAVVGDWNQDGRSDLAVAGE